MTNKNTAKIVDEDSKPVKDEDEFKSRIISDIASSQAKSEQSQILLEKTNLNFELQKLKSEKESLNQEIVDLKENTSWHKKNLEKIELKKNKYDEEITQRQNEVTQLLKQVNNAEAEKSKLEEQIAENAAKYEKIKDEYQKLTSSSDKLNEEFRNKKFEFQNLEEKLEQAKEQQISLRGELEHDANEVKTLRRLLKELDQELQGKKSELALTTVSLKNKEDQARLELEQIYEEVNKTKLDLREQVKVKQQEADKYYFDKKKAADDEAEKLIKEAREKCAQVEAEWEEKINIRKQAVVKLKQICRKENSDLIELTKTQAQSIIENAKTEQKIINTAALTAAEEIKSKASLEAKKLIEQTRKDNLKTIETAKEEAEQIEKNAKDLAVEYTKKSKTVYETKENEAKELASSITVEASAEAEKVINEARIQAKAILKSAEAESKEILDTAKSDASKVNEESREILENANKKADEILDMAADKKKELLSDFQKDIAADKLKMAQDLKTWRREKEKKWERESKYRSTVLCNKVDIFFQGYRQGNVKSREMLEDIKVLNKRVKQVIIRNFEEEDELDPQTLKKSKNQIKSNKPMGEIWQENFKPILYALSSIAVVSMIVVFLPTESKRSAVDMYVEKELHDKKPAKYKPEQTPGFKKSYTENVIYTQYFKEIENDAGYQKKWTLALKDFFDEKLDLAPTKIAHFIPVEKKLFKELVSVEENLNSQNYAAAIENMKKIESEAMEKLQSVVTNEEKLQRVFRFKKIFFMNYRQSLTSDELEALTE